MSILVRSIVAGSIAAETIVTRFVVAEFINAGSFVAEYIVPWFIFADSTDVKLLLQGPLHCVHCCEVHFCKVH